MVPPLVSQSPEKMESEQGMRVSTTKAVVFGSHWRETEGDYQRAGGPAVCECGCGRGLSWVHTVWPELRSQVYRPSPHSHHKAQNKRHFFTFNGGEGSTEASMGG